MNNLWNQLLFKQIFQLFFFDSFVYQRVFRELVFFFRYVVEKILREFRLELQKS